VSNLTIATILAPLAVLGVLAGVYLVRRISVKRFYQIAYVLVAVIALKLVWDGSVGVFLSGTTA
jgi:uncharacterized membrane protein YfcA